jgi:hypothetical protein
MSDMDYIEKAQQTLDSAVAALEDRSADGRGAEAVALALVGVGHAILASGHAVSPQLYGLRKATAQADGEARQA